MRGLRHAQFNHLDAWGSVSTGRRRCRRRGGLRLTSARPNAGRAPASAGRAPERGALYIVKGDPDAGYLVHGVTVR